MVKVTRMFSKTRLVKQKWALHRRSSWKLYVLRGISACRRFFRDWHYTMVCMVFFVRVLPTFLRGD